jgi:hypothetical protein
MLFRCNLSAIGWQGLAKWFLSYRFRHGLTTDDSKNAIVGSAGNPHLSFGQSVI